MAKIPKEIGKYKILSHLGSGGTSIVYLGVHPTLKRKVVIKKLNLRGKKAFYDRFIQEAALMMDLNHDHIVKVYDHFREASRHYIVMEFVEGASLDQIVEQSGPLDADLIRYILRCCCKALAYIHGKGIVHRDIKPSNIFISHTGDVKIGDFGIAMLEDPDQKEITAGQTILGTPSYMAPEQFLANRKITGRTDLYALAVSYYELLTSRKLFQGDSLEQLRKSIVKGRHKSLFPLIVSHGPSTWWLIQRSTFRISFFRFANAQKVFRLLKGFRSNDKRQKEELCLKISAESQKKRQVDFSDVLGAEKKRKWKTMLAGLTFFFLFIFGLISSYNTGLVYKWFFSSRMGEFSIHLDVSDLEDEHGIDKLVLYTEKNGESKIVETWDSFSTGSIQVYKNTAYYQLKCIWGNRITWNTFYLPPMENQDEPLYLYIQAPNPVQENVALDYQLRDALTGMVLEEGSFFYRSFGDQDWKPLREDSLVSGNHYAIRIEHPGYYPQSFDLNLAFYQDEMSLALSLQPLPGQLAVQHNLDQLQLRVNQKKRLAGGDESRTIQKFSTIELEGNLWTLAPGVYELEWSGSGWSQVQKLTIRQKERVIYRIYPDDDGLPQFDIDRQPLKEP